MAQHHMEDSDMTLANILKQKGSFVHSMLPTARIDAVVALLAEHRIGAILVRDSIDQLLGILSERDVVRSLAANGARTLEMTAGQLMTPNPVSATSGTSVVEAMEIMSKGKFRHLPVINDGKILGLVSIRDVVKARVDQQAYEVDSLKAYVSGGAHA